jgi:hypothetical protein
MKSILTILLAAALITGYSQQSSPVPNEIKLYAEAAGQKIQSCCSSWGGKNLEISIESWDINSLSNRVKIILTVSWTGSMSGNRYWVKGKLNCDIDGCNPVWTKMDDSKMLPSGCGQNCIKVCLE